MSDLNKAEMIPYIMKDVMDFRRYCLEQNKESDERTIELGVLGGIKVSLELSFEKPKLTPEQEAAIEKMVTKRWESQHHPSTSEQILSKGFVKLPEE